MDRLCTIISLNYLPQAMALLDSTKKIYPNIDFFILITDAKSRDQKGLEWATVLLPEDLDIPSDWLADMRSYYDLVELATSFKPFLLKTLLAGDVSTATFLDPDILVFSELEDGMSAAKSTGIAITPHRLTPSNIVTSNFSELSFLRYGIFNLGYIAVGQKALPMLQWWSERLRWYCTRFPDDVVFTDQKWINFVPAFYDHTVIRNPGYNFAPWNIDERPLGNVNGVLYINEIRLVFIHFSQMSSILANGGSTDLWQRGIGTSDEGAASLKLISSITEGYSETLVRFGNSTGESPELRIAKKFDQRASFHFRQKLIRRSIDAALKDKNTHHHYKATKRISGVSRSIIRLFERSATLNGARRGFYQDFPKITQRLRNFFHK
jgi:hypothetical protein